MKIFAIILFLAIALIEAIFINTHHKKYIIIRYINESHNVIIEVPNRCFYNIKSAAAFAYRYDYLYYEIKQIV